MTPAFLGVGMCALKVIADRIIAVSDMYTYYQ